MLAHTAYEMARGSITRNDRPSARPSRLGRILDVFEAVITDGFDSSLASITSHTALPKSTTHRLLAVLSQHGYVVPLEHGHYAPGPQVFVIAGLASTFHDYARVARPILADLRCSTEETIHLALLVGNEAIYIEKLEGNRPYRMPSEVGKRLPLHSTAIGKAILASLLVRERDRVLAQLPLSRRTTRTITDRPSLVTEIAITRKRRYAIDDEEDEDGIRCVSAAFRGHQDTTLGAISVSAPAFNLSTVKAHALAPAVVTAADALSRALGAPISQRPA